MANVMVNIEQACDEYIGLMLKRDDLNPENQPKPTPSEPKTSQKDQEFEKTLRL